MSTKNVNENGEKGLGGSDGNAEVKVLYEGTELARRLKSMDENHKTVKSILDSIKVTLIKVINRMTTKQRNIAAVVKSGVNGMKDKITALKAIRDQHMNEKNVIELLL